MSDTQVEAEPWANRIVEYAAAVDHQWARDIRDACHSHPGTPAFYFKQSAAPRTETGIELDGELHENYPHPHPSIRQTPEGTRVTVPGAR